MGMGGLGPDVLRLVESWIPSQVYDHEREYQSELQNFLDDELNSGGSGPMGGFGGTPGGYPVTTEHGTSYGDVVVDGTVGIELKRNFSNDQKKKLRGQIEEYADNYNFVIACACGIDDRDGWRELENRYSGSTGFGFDATQFAFVVKKKEMMGADQRQDNRGGFLDDVFGGGQGGLF